jgi:cell division transport system permease protein
MGKKRKETSRRTGMQVVTLCISTTMVLTLLGLVVLSVLTARNLSNYVKEHLTVTVVLSDSVSEREGTVYCQQLGQRHYARQVTYISKEQALKEQTAAMGSDPSEFLGMNPFVATIEMQVLADYANPDSLQLIAKTLRKNRALVSDVAYQEDLTAQVNRNLQQASLVLLGLAVLLIIISYSLISNSVRLSVYSRRFTIHTMKLVGASWGFIRAPFLRRAINIGIVSSLLACAVLGVVVWCIYRYQPGVEEVITWKELGATGVAVLVFGFVMMLLCSLLSVNKFLRMKAGEIYKI